jgi:hypothetical protein
MNKKEFGWIIGILVAATLIMIFNGFYLLTAFSFILVIIAIILRNRIKVNENEDKTLFCDICGKKTEHLKCGFGTPGGLTGNARYRCKECGKERI